MAKARWIAKEIQDAKEERDAPRDLVDSKFGKKDSAILMILGAVLGVGVGLLLGFNNISVLVSVILGVTTGSVFNFIPMIKYWSDRQEAKYLLNKFLELKDMSKEELLKEYEIRKEAYLRWEQNGYKGSYEQEIEKVRESFEQETVEEVDAVKNPKPTEKIKPVGEQIIKPDDEKEM